MNHGGGIAPSDQGSLVHRDTNRYDLTVKSGHRAAVIQTTRNHLFWDPAAGRWTKAAALKYGTRLRTRFAGPVTRPLPSALS